MAVARHTEITAGGSTVDEAIRNGVERAAQTLDNVQHVWVKGIKAQIDGNRISEFRVDMKVTFVLKE